MKERRFRNLLPNLAFNPDVHTPRVPVLRASGEARDQPPGAKAEREVAEILAS